MTEKTPVRKDEDRIPALPVEKFTEEQARLVGDWKHLIFSRVLINSPRMYGVFVPHIEVFIARAILSPRDRPFIRRYIFRPAAMFHNIQAIKSNRNERSVRLPKVSPCQAWTNLPMAM